MRIAIGNWKGGSGKTTASMYLAQAVGSTGSTVTLIDADPQGSVTTWVPHLAPDNTTVRAPQPSRLVAELDRATTDVVIVDLPPADENLARKTYALVDVVVIPTRTSGIEFARVAVTVAAIPPKTPYGLVITGGRPHLTSYKQFLEGYEQRGWPVWATIPERTEIAAGESWNADGIRAAALLWHNITKATS